MSDPVPIPQGWLTWAVGIFASLLTGNFVYFLRKVDKIDERMKAFVTREELAAIEARIDMRAQSAETRGVTMHSDNTNNFREVRLQLESVNSKLFELASK